MLSYIPKLLKVERSQWVSLLSYLTTFLNRSVKVIIDFLKRSKSTFIKIIVLLILLASTIFLPGIIQKAVITLKFKEAVSPTLNIEQHQQLQQKIGKEIAGLDKKLAARIPKSYYMIINTASNEFSLYKGTQLVKKDKCSTGSYVLLKNGDDQEWMFKTPKGEFRIQGKTTSPVWRKPDWAFVEAGLPVPPANHHSRYEYGVLGDYALSLGQGYLIHGTLYQRFLGLPVTHGCVRLNDENLELIYKSLATGSKVYIY